MAREVDALGRKCMRLLSVPLFTFHMDPPNKGGAISMAATLSVLFVVLAQRRMPEALLLWFFYVSGCRFVLIAFCNITERWRIMSLPRRSGTPKLARYPVSRIVYLWFLPFF